MRSRRQPGRTFVRAMLCFVPALLALACFSGCDDTYDETLLYPPRTDYLVSAPPKVLPTRFEPPGMHPLQSLTLTNHAFGPDRDLLKKERDENKNIFNPLDLPATVRNKVAYVLRDLAGRPAAPKIDLNNNSKERSSSEDLTKVLIRDLKLDRKTLAEGSRLYRKQCLHCHGVAGDGRGPTAMWVNPHPRDYRQGLFKFTSTGGNEGSRKPRREDLRRVLLNGVEGTSMPSFHLLPPDEIEALISYVIHLSIRGQAEYLTLIDLCDKKKQLDGKRVDLKAAEAKKDQAQLTTLNEEYETLNKELTESQADRVRKNAAFVAQHWVDSQKSDSPNPVFLPAPEFAKKFEEMTEEQRLKSAARGYRIFTIKELGGCVECHTNIGRDSSHRYDSWATIVKPRNLLANNLRGGRRPIDIYWRIATGINGSGMPALIASEDERTKTLQTDIKPGDDAVLKEIKTMTKEEWIWDLVNFIQMVPYPEKRQQLKSLDVVIDAETESTASTKSGH